MQFRNPNSAHRCEIPGEFNRDSSNVRSPRKGGRCFRSRAGHGQATAIAVAECGADVALVDRNVDGAEAAAEQIRTLCRNVLVDEVFGPCSVASEIAARIADAGFDELDAPIKCLTGSFTPTPYAPTLEAAIVPQVVDVENAIRDLLAE